MAQRNGLVVEIDRSGSRLGDLCAVLSRFAHAAGTPVFGVISWSMLWSGVPREHNMALVYSDGNPIAGYFQLEMGDACYGVWGAALHEYLELRPVYLAYWELLADTTARGFKRLDMGRASRLQRLEVQGAMERPTGSGLSADGSFARRTRDGKRGGRAQSDSKFSWCAVFVATDCLTRLLSFWDQS